MNDHIRTIKNIQIVFIVLLVLSIIGFVTMLFTGELDFYNGFIYVVEILLLSLFVRMISAITDAIEAAYLKAIATKPLSNQQSFHSDSSRRLSQGEVSSAWRDLNGDK